MITILSIDTSCDETSAAVTRGLNVLSNIQPSQMEFHKKYGGVVPSLAKLAHMDRIDNVVDEALKRAGVSMNEIEYICVTHGPGLAIALEVGLKKAKQLAEEFKKPLIPINHMEGHLLSAFAAPNSKNNVQQKPNIELPALGILVSGKHTEIIEIKKIGKYTKIGETLDDACGEAFDKCGRILGLGYPAGPVLTKLAQENRKNIKFQTKNKNKSTYIICTNKHTEQQYELPIAMANSKDFNFSYSGLKTAFNQLVNTIKAEGDLTKQQILDLAVAFEAAAIKPIELKLATAIEKYKPKQVLLGGGVVASTRLRSRLRKVCRDSSQKPKLLYPYTYKLTTDNAAMIGVAAYCNLIQTPNVLDIYTDPKDFEKIDRQPRLSL